MENYIEHCNLILMGVIQCKLLHFLLQLNTSFNKIILCHLRQEAAREGEAE